MIIYRNFQFGWFIIIASDIAFAGAAVFETKRLYVSESDQQSLVNSIMLVMDVSLATVLLVLAILMVWRLVDLFRRNGQWARHMAGAQAAPQATTTIESPRPSPRGQEATR